MFKFALPKSRLTGLFRKSFIRNVAMVASGTAVAQAVTISFYPVITRIYGPDAFGALGLFMSAVTILTPLATLAYPTAIVLPKSEANAMGLLRLALIIASVTSAIVGILLTGFWGPIVTLFGLQQIASLLPLLPLVMLLASTQEVLYQWLIRRKKFTLIASLAMLQSLLINIAKAGFGLIYPFASVLILISVLGYVLYASILFIGGHLAGVFQSIKAPDASAKPMGELARDYADFPLYRAPQDLLNALSQGLPLILLASLYGVVVAGHYTLAFTILAAPVTLIGNAVGNVLYPRLAEAAHRGEDLRRLVVLPTLSLFSIGLIPFGAIMLAGPFLFSWIFGAEWRESGEYARWLALWIFCGFANIPSVRAVPVVAEQKALLVFGIISAITRVVSVFSSFQFGLGPNGAIVTISVTGAILNILLIYILDRRISQARMKPQ